jgi:hypothetical protein
VSDNPSPAPDAQRVSEQSGIPLPNPAPYSHITAALVAWNEESRIGPLLRHLRPFFDTLAVGVQKGDDRTADIASDWADILVFDEHRGFGDATFGPRVLPQITTRWAFKVDCDEWPDPELLSSLSTATWYAETNDYQAVWIPFRSSVEGIEYEEQHAHMRLFQTRLGWPGLLHSRPPADRSCLWGTGHIRHDRSLDEMMQDYLRYWKVGRGNPGWDAHNRLMMESACRGTAAIKGWDYVRNYPWWPEVEAIAFDGVHTK